MKKQTGNYVVFGLCLFIMAFVIYVGWHKLGEDLCGNEDFVYADSPSKQHQAVMYVRSCGATTGFLTIVQVEDKKALSVNGYYEKEIIMRWTDDKSLEIEYSGKKEDIFSTDSTYKDININLIQK